MRTGWLLFSWALLVGPACSKHVDEPAQGDFKPASGTPVDPGPAELQKTDEVVGTGREVKNGDTVSVRYVGTLLSGAEFDSTKEGAPPFEFELGAGKVIKGWDQGVPGMKVGGKRRLVIPQALAYGDKGSPPKIPPKAGLKFEIELTGVK
jgi:FKBP-type peptidyl-prolyl cis-trans isomerase FkpA